jgi:hypothetical protein
MKAATSNGAAFFFRRTGTMAFSIRDLSVLAYANGFTLWHYKAGPDSLTDIACDDYFADASDMMAAGDMLMISGAKAARILSVAVATEGNVRSVPVG